MNIWEQLLIKLGELDLWSMGIGIVLTVVTFYVVSVIRKKTKKTA